MHPVRVLVEDEGGPLPVQRLVAVAISEQPQENLRPVTQLTDSLLFFRPAHPAGYC